MKKSGLQKKIAFIFENGSEPPAGSAPSVVLEPPAPESTAVQVEKQTQVNNCPAGQVTPASEPQTQLDAKNRPQRDAQRPMPLPRNRVQPSGKNEKLITRLKKAVSNKSLQDPRQKKMAMAAGLLAAVLLVVVFISLGGAGQNKPKNSKIKAVANAATAATKVNSKLPEWKKPEPLPDEIRDPMKPQSLHLSVQAGSQQSAPGEFIVKGIVFSQTPSALVNNEIVKEGQSLGGVNIAKITKTEVEFELNGKRWTQTVQR